MALDTEDSSWKKIHFEDATVIDLHTHTSLKASLFKRLISQHPIWRTRKGFYPFSIRTNFELLQEGGVDVVCSVVYPPETEILRDVALIKLFGLKLGRLRQLRYLLGVLPMWRTLLQGSYFDVAMRGMDNLEKEVDAYNKDVDRHNRRKGNQQSKRRVEIVKSSKQLKELLKKGKDAPIGLIQAVEGAHSLQGKEGTEKEILDNLVDLHKRGVAYLTLGHFYPNKVVNPCFPFPEYVLDRIPESRMDSVWRDLTLGLTPIGEKVVKKMLELGMIIDVSHCTPVARQQVYNLVGDTNYCVTATHVGAYSIKPSPYNLEDWEIQWIAEHKGVIGVIFMNYWLMPHETKLGLDFISRTVEHLVNIGGAEIVAIGTDFDGFTDPPDEIPDASQLPRLTQRLLAERSDLQGQKYDPPVVRRILGENALTMLLQGWK